MRKKVHKILEEILANTAAETRFGKFLTNLYRAVNLSVTMDCQQEAALRALLQILVAREDELRDAVNFVQLTTSTAAWLNSCHE